MPMSKHQPQIIGLTSTRGASGKDTLLEHLEHAGYKVTRVAFGDILKEQCAEAISSETFTSEELLQMFHSNQKDVPTCSLSASEIPRGEYRDWLVNTVEDTVDMHGWYAPRSPRWHLQQWGTGFMRDYKKDPDVWLNLGLKAIKEAPAGSIVCVTDLRQTNEYVGLSKYAEETGQRFCPVRLHRMWFKAGIDDQPYHATDVDLIGFFMSAVVLNEFGKPEDMVTQLTRQLPFPKVPVKEIS